MLTKQIPSVNNYFLTVPSKELLLDQAALIRTSTPTNFRRSNSLNSDMFGRKFSSHKRSVDSLNAKQTAVMNVDEIEFEIRNQLENAKDEINSMQY